MAKLVKKHDALVIKYEAAQFVAETKDVRPQHREKLCGSKVDSLSTFQKQLDEMEDVMRKLQDDLKHKVDFLKFKEPLNLISLCLKRRGTLNPTSPPLALLKSRCVCVALSPSLSIFISPFFFLMCLVSFSPPRLFVSCFARMCGNRCHGTSVPLLCTY